MRFLVLPAQDTASCVAAHVGADNDTPENGVHRATPDFTSVGVSRLLNGLPRLTARTARLLVHGDLDGVYASTDALTALRLRAGEFVPGEPEHGRSLLGAVILGAVNAGWTDEQLWEALVRRPTPAGEWLRAARRRRGEEYAREQLARYARDARAKATASPAYTTRADVAGELAEIEALICAHRWSGATASTDLCVLAAHHSAAESAGGPEHSLSYRQAAEAAGVSLSTLQGAYKRLGAWLVAVRVPGPSDGEQDATVWRWRNPSEIRTRLEQALQLELGQPEPSYKTEHLPAPPPAQVRGVPGMQLRIVKALMGADAFSHAALGKTGLRLVAALQLGEGTSVAELAEQTGLHTTTVYRRTERLVAGGFARWLDGLLYIHPDLGELAEQPSLHLAVRPEEDQDHEQLEPEVAELAERLARSAQGHGTHGTGARRAWRHQQDRRARSAALSRLSEHRRADVPAPRVPAEHIDPDTGMGTGPMTGWDCTDPFRPIWRDDLGGPEWRVSAA
jgi:hypothetical protein